MEKLAIGKEFAGGQERNCLHRETRNWVWLSAVPHCLNGTDLSFEEFQENICLRYGMMHQDITTTCNGCSKRFLIEPAISCLKGEIVMARHNEAAKEWGYLGARALVPIAITHEPKINSSIVYRERTRARAR